MFKDIWNVDCDIWRVYYKQNTSSICGISGLRKAEKMSMPADENIEALKKTILDNRRITIR